MLKMLRIATAGFVLAMGLAGAPAQAVPINGTLGLTDTGLVLSNLPGSIVGNLNSINQGVGNSGPCLNDFAIGIVCGVTQSTSPTIINLLLLNGGGGIVYTFGPWTFTITGVSNIIRTGLHSTGLNLLGDALQFDIAGTVTGLGRDPTLFGGTWTGNGSCQGVVLTGCVTGTAGANWSITLVATGQVSRAPEPGTLALLGLGLAGLGFARRRKA